MKQDEPSTDGWLPAKEVQPEDFIEPFEVRVRVDPPPGMDFWDRPLWLFGHCDGQHATENPQISFTHHSDSKDGHRQLGGWPLKTLYPILIDFVANVAEEHLLIKIDLRNVEVRPTLTAESTKIRAERRNYPIMTTHKNGWKKAHDSA